MQNKKGQQWEQIITGVLAVGVLVAVGYLIFFASKTGGEYAGQLKPADVTRMAGFCQGYMVMGNAGLSEYCQFRNYQSTSGANTYVNCDYKPVFDIIKTNAFAGKCGDISITPEIFCKGLQSNANNKASELTYIYSGDGAGTDLKVNTNKAYGVSCDLSKAGDLDASKQLVTQPEISAVAVA